MFGLKLQSSSNKRKRDTCFDPEVDGADDMDYTDTMSSELLSQNHNLAAPSALSRYVLLAVPAHNLKKFPNLVSDFYYILGQELEHLFNIGVPWDKAKTNMFVSVLGQKADEEWQDLTAGGFVRSYRHLGIVTNIPICIECGAGGRMYPFEESGRHALWHQSIAYMQRPWRQTPTVLVHTPYVVDGKPETFFKRDPFHISKHGVYRDFIGSSIVTICLLGIFDEGSPNESVAIENRLSRAFAHFLLVKLLGNLLSYERSVSVGWDSRASFLCQL